MHELIKLYARAGKVRLIGRPSLFVYRHLPHRVREAAVHSLYHIRRGHLPDTRFLIFAVGRSGSTLLVDLMNSHPDIFTFGEILSHNVVENARDPRKFVEGLSTLSRRPACGFKVKVYQISHIQKKDPGTVLRDFHEHGWKIIHLRRTNLLRHAISGIRAVKTGQFHNVDRSVSGEFKNARGRQVRIEFSEIEDQIRFLRDCEEKELRALEGLPRMLIEYEKDLMDADAQRMAMGRVFEYLELAPHQAETVFKKVTSKEIARDVENGDELTEAVSRSEYAEYLGWG